MKRHHSYLLITFLIVCWGASWPIYKLAVPFIPPLFFAGLRATIGGILLTLCLWSIRHQLQWKRFWKLYILAALLNTAFFLGFQTTGLNYLPGGLFSVLVYFQPILVGVFSWLFLKESLSPLKWFGLLLGFIGVALVSGSSIHSFSFIGVLMALATAFFWALGVIIIKRFSAGANPYWIVSCQLLIGGGLLLFFGLVTEEIQNTQWNIEVLSGIAFGVTLGLPVSYLVYYKLIREGVATKVAASTFLVPIVAVLLGVIFLQETLTLMSCVGIVLVAVSILLVNRT